MGAAPEETPPSLADDGTELRCVPTGVRAVDRLIRGFPRGVSATIHGTRGAGKSTLALALADGLAKRIGGPALIVAPEMSRKVLAHTARGLSDRSRLAPVKEPLSWEAEARRYGARVLVIDSVSAFPKPLETLNQAIAWARKIEGVALLLAQQNSRGKPLGPAGISFNPDAVFLVEADPDGARWFSVDGKCRWAPFGRAKL